MSEYTQDAADAGKTAGNAIENAVAGITGSISTANDAVTEILC